MIRFLTALFLVAALDQAAFAGSYPYHPSSVLRLGGTFDPENMQLSFPPCIVYDREYAVHPLGRQHAVEAGPGDEKNKTPAENVSAHNELSIEQIKTREHMYSFLNISTTISAHYKLFSASASVGYESEGIFDSDSFTFGVRGITRFAEIGLINPRLTKEASVLVKNLPAFYSRCGREWVTQETRGVQIAVVYTVKNVSQSQRSRLEASLSAGVSGGPLFGGDVSVKLTKILQSAFVSNYYTARIFAIGGNGVSDFAQTITEIDDPTKVLKSISDYLKTLNYGNSVPMSFQTGSLDQFISSQQEGALLFDPVNRRLASLFLAYEEYRARRSDIWRFLNDDGQASWGSKIDDPAWERLKQLEQRLRIIEERAQFCRTSAGFARKIDLRRRGGQPQQASAALADDQAGEFLRNFSTGISARAVDRGTEALIAVSTPTSARPTCEKPPSKPVSPRDDPALGKSYLCQCLSDEENPYLESRFPLNAIPHVDVKHDKDTFAPRSLVYVSVKGAAAVESAVVTDQSGREVIKLRSGYDPSDGPVWYGAFPYKTAEGPPPLETLPYVVEIVDRLGRRFTKPFQE